MLLIDQSLEHLNSRSAMFSSNFKALLKIVMICHYAILTGVDSELKMRINLQELFLHKKRFPTAKETENKKN